MESALISPAQATFLGIPLAIFALIIPVLGVTAFIYILARRSAPLVRALPDPRLDQIPQRIRAMLKYALAQYRHPRYMTAGVLHILLFAGFMILSLRSLTLVMVGLVDGYTLPGLGGPLGPVYEILKDIAATMVLGAVIVAAARRLVFKPARYAVPPSTGLKDHTWEAVMVLGLIATLVAADMIFEGTLAAAQHQLGQEGHFILPGTGRWIAAGLLAGSPMESLQSLHVGSYYIHELTFFFFLCFLPMGKHFHVITSFPNVLLKKMKKGVIKPVRHGVSDQELDDLESFGVKTFEEFTWKHMLDFYTCVDCGRCSDNCPANAAGRPLSPRFISIKGREYAFNHYPLKGPITPSDDPLIGHLQRR
jgi:ferredoxin